MQQMGRELAQASPARYAVRAETEFAAEFEESTLTTSGIRRASPPQAVTKVRDNYFLIQVSITETPERGLAAAVLRRAGAGRAAGFCAAVGGNYRDVSAIQVRLRDSVEEKIAVLDRWMERANQKEAAMAGRTEVQRQKAGRSRARGAGIS